MKCLICNDNDADKTGSHIIPHSIIESNVNSRGAKGRDKEQSFHLGETSADFFFGRSVNPEGLEDILGHKVTEDDIEKNSHHYARNHIFCTTCETKLGHLESLYKSEVDKSIRNERELTEDQLRILQCFWISVILRCSVTQFSKFKLDQALEDSVKAVLNEILVNTQIETKQNCLGASFSFTLKVFVNVGTHDKTRNSTLLHPDYAEPYILFINEYILLFEFRHMSQIKALGELLKIDLSKSNSLNVSYLPNSDWEKVISYCMGIKAKQMYIRNVERFQQAFWSRHFVMPMDELTKRYMHELVFDDSVDEGLKYGEARIGSLIEKYIS
jgi:hypothetical protein